MIIWRRAGQEEGGRKELETEAVRNLPPPGALILRAGLMLDKEGLVMNW